MLIRGWRKVLLRLKLGAVTEMLDLTYVRNLAIIAADHGTVSLMVIVKTFAALASEPSGVDIFLEQRARTIFRIAEPFVQHI